MLLLRLLLMATAGWLWEGWAGCGSYNLEINTVTSLGRGTDASFQFSRHEVVGIIRWYWPPGPPRYWIGWVEF